MKTLVHSDKTVAQLEHGFPTPALVTFRGMRADALGKANWHREGENADDALEV